MPGPGWVMKAPRAGCSVVLLIQWLVSAKRDAASDAALDILRQRSARGEIDREEFLARKRDL